jgi:hypothetical protein
MVFLSLDRGSALEAIALAKVHGHAVWVGADAISEAEHQAFGEQGVKLSRFIYPLAGADADQVQDALATVVEHHPGEVVWVQHRL